MLGICKAWRRASNPGEPEALARASGALASASGSRTIRNTSNGAGSSVHATRSSAGSTPTVAVPVVPRADRFGVRALQLVAAGAEVGCARLADGRPAYSGRAHAAYPRNGCERPAAQ